MPNFLKTVNEAIKCLNVLEFFLTHYQNFEEYSLCKVLFSLGKWIIYTIIFFFLFFFNKLFGGHFLKKFLVMPIFCRLIEFLYN